MKAKKRQAQAREPVAVPIERIEGRFGTLAYLAQVLAVLFVIYGPIVLWMRNFEIARIVVCALGACLAGWSALQVGRAWGVRRWLPVEATMTRLALRSTPVSTKNGLQWDVALEVGFDYDSPAGPCHSRRFARDPGAAPRLRGMDVEASLRAWQVGARVTAWRSPGEGRQAVLCRDVSLARKFGYAAAAAAGLLLLAIGAMLPTIL